MKSEKIDLGPVKKLLDRHSEHKSPYQINFKDLEILLHPEVFNPNYTKVSGFLAEHLDAKPGEKCLEMFSGSGALSLIAGKTASSVLGVDISSVAIDYSNFNAVRLGLGNRVNFKNGNLWNVVDPGERFDFIFANPPLLPAIPETLLEMAVADSPEMSLTREFITGAAKFVDPNGRIYMALSSACSVYVGDPVDFVASVANSVDLDTSIKAEWDVGYEIYRIIEFRPRRTN